LEDNPQFLAGNFLFWDKDLRVSSITTSQLLAILVFSEQKTSVVEVSSSSYCAIDYKQSELDDRLLAQNL